MSSSAVVIPSADLACTPWEMTSFDPEPHRAKNGGVNLPTVEQISGIEEQARQEGYQAGHAEGYAQGMLEAQREAERLRSLADGFSTEVRQADETISRQVLELSLDFARAVLKTALTVQPDLVLPIVREAVRYLPALHQPAMLYLHPDDTALVRTRMGDELGKIGWLLADDERLERGSCRVETANNQIDASLPTRWQRMAAALSQNSEWLAP
jgi:flagellar assembly protein FliH